MSLFDRVLLVSAAILLGVVLCGTAKAGGDHLYRGKCVRTHTTAEHGDNLARAYAFRKWRDPSPVRRKGRYRLARDRVCADSRQARRKMKAMGRISKRRFYRHFLDLLYPPGRDVLYAIRDCESGTSGLYRAVDSSGTHFGGYQFDLGTWASVGGHGYPHEARPREQDWRAARLYRSRGSQPWPICG